jgi:hypothetical protein
MTKGGKAIKYMVKNAKARKILKKVKKMRKNVMFVLAWVCESQIIKSVAQSSKLQSSLIRANSWCISASSSHHMVD